MTQCCDYYDQTCGNVTISSRAHSTREHPDIVITMARFKTFAFLESPEKQSQHTPHIVSSLDKDDRLTNVVHEQLLRRLVGWVEVPFSTVYAKGKVDGWLRIHRPLFFTGYSMPDRPSYLKVLIAFDPQLVPPRIQPPRRVESVENEKILAQCQAWSKACSAVNDTRRYAALFLALGCGDEEEHAVLLCCWLLSLQIPNCLVLGFALPEGSKAAYVFVNLPDGIYLVNPCDGAIYPSTDAMCPLISVGTVVTPKNAYGNIQSQDHPSQLQFDLNKSSDWKPLFDRELDEIQTVQAPSVSYVEVSEDALVELRSSIEREIKLRFDEARKYGIPQWNLMASRLLREILQDEHGSLDARLARLRDSYTVTVTAITIPYRNVQECVAAVLRCGLHTTTSTSSQFALAVHLQPVFGHVLGCSIAIALLTLRM
ncbi:hypothetical protein ANCCEY_10655 [Ancylostoma ceylanicum]|uniref:CEP76/DRC7 peptidase-like domain-containing protein n=1 Tax=Ancylostoma ceylanicum TaxID=53326 RepID=A0A0D6LJX1_9BILA|nr:hypothetical protein ANCCEY_10655 [Ancylostoma ceylanicum]